MKRSKKFIIGVILLAFGAIGLLCLFGNTADKASLAGGSILVIAGGAALVYFDKHPRKFKKWEIGAIIVAVFVFVGISNPVLTWIFGEGKSPDNDISALSTGVVSNTTEPPEETSSAIGNDNATDTLAESDTDTSTPAETDTGTTAPTDSANTVTEPAVTQPSTQGPPTVIPDTSAPPAPETSGVSIPPVDPVVTDTPITLISAPGTVHRNEIVSLSISGKPNTEYRLRIRYKSGWSEADGLGRQTSDANGNVTWTWKVGGKTTFGTWPMEISGEGKTVSLEYTVVE